MEPTAEVGSSYVILNIVISELTSNLLIYTILFTTAGTAWLQDAISAGDSLYVRHLYWKV